MKSDIAKMIRPEITNFAPYIAGRPIESVKKEYGLRRVIKLASNENPLGASPLAVSALKKSAGGIFRYPDSDSTALREAIAAKTNQKPSNIVAGGGSDELIEIIAKTFFTPGDEIVISSHAFIRYKMAGELMGSKITEIPVKRNLAHDLIQMAYAVTKKTKAVFIANPNNPTGTYSTVGEFEKFLSILAERKLFPLVVIDEAYYEYATFLSDDYPDSTRYFSRYPNLITLRTFSKIYGLAGLRLGYALCAATETAKQLNRVRPPFNVNIASQIAGIAALNDREHLKKSLAVLDEGLDYLYLQFRKMGIGFIPTAGNFILVEARPFKGADIFNELLRKGVIVRATDEYGLPDYFRVTVGLPRENRIFISALKKIFTKCENKS